MNMFIHHHPILLFGAGFLVGGIIMAIYVWRSLGGRFLP